MGVPRLWGFVSQTKLGERKVFACRTDPAVSVDDVEKVHLIFDGPSFAYWFWREASIKEGITPIYTQLI
jgi:hypothetical protein